MSRVFLVGAEVSAALDDQVADAGARVASRPIRRLLVRYLRSSPMYFTTFEVYTGRGVVGDALLPILRRFAGTGDVVST